eukprot:2908593-Rhodomonas_salina.2
MVSTLSRNAPISGGTWIVIPSTFPSRAKTENTSPSVPTGSPSAGRMTPAEGGMTRVAIRPAGTGLTTVTRIVTAVRS